MPKSKLILLIFVFLTIIFAASYFLYIVFFKSATPTKIPVPVVIDKTQPTTSFPIAKEGTPTTELTDKEKGLELKKTITKQIKEDLNQIIEISDKVTETAKGSITKTTQLTENYIVSPSFSKKSNNINFYDPLKSQFYKTDKFGNIVALSDKKFYNVSNVVWSPTEDQGIIEYPDGSNIIYNFETKKQVTLPEHWESFSFNPIGKEFSFLSYSLNSENNWLAIADTNGGNTQIVEHLGDNGSFVNVDWSPNNEVVALYRKPISAEQQEVYFIGKNNENFKLTVVEGMGLESQWSDNGKKLLYSVYNSADNYKPSLWIVNAQGETIGTQRKKLPVNTFADRCVFSQNDVYVYCAEPVTVPDYAGYLPNLLKEGYTDQNGDSVPVPSMIVKVNLNTGTKDIISIPEDMTDITEIFINKEEDTLFYTDDYDGTLKKINL